MVVGGESFFSFIHRIAESANSRKLGFRYSRFSETQRAQKSRGCSHFWGVFVFLATLKANARFFFFFLRFFVPVSIANLQGQ